MGESEIEKEQPNFQTKLFLYRLKNAHMGVFEARQKSYSNWLSLLKNSNLLIA
ncbi:MAG: hypothetical protein UY26_C0002G0010 [Candidatus Jorgensenbacteria bacterium GW2011_GWA1_48_13]|uniref:Uncharacterized protein n=1 Tax=Candidatus Jorgensenbacteria bacterium GW2011_GWB1_50_10 TaxID=1618665 RepID=A0A0G1WA54_9BACT|nr:MAG: hypothetical protein UY26_C0002G0010 [Candidatus Jorgensenbacteria bacterium GW2011_GWA1_48_13]KKW15500.1 MAG: hypothetical protein UY55_C0001G0254 [Candidatus Jorgensenbacteria bacterium GW2011_GWB1_50_10]